MTFKHRMIPLALAAAMLCAGASAEPPPAQQATLTAAQQAADAGDYRRADDLLDDIKVNGLDATRQNQFNILRAQILLARDEPEEALKWLRPSGVAGAQAAQIYWLRGQALFGSGNAPGATYELVQREKYLSPTQFSENRDAIWTGLFETPMDMSVLANLKNLDTTTRGWVELAVLVREHGDLNGWRASYPGHPAASRIDSVRAGVSQPLAAQSQQAPQPAAPTLSQRLFGGLFGVPPDANSYALLLPLSGAYSATAEAVRDGFLSAYFKKTGSKPSVRIYDAGATASSSMAAYQQALREGAGFVIGPLRKDGLASIVDAGQPPVPVLALNYLDGNRSAFNVFQFGLAPEDEARAAAERAVAEGGRRAITFAPATDWGDRALAAFNQRLTELGGSVIAASRYDLASRDFSEPIRVLLGVDASEERHKALSNTLARNTEFESRRRDDADFIFIVARPAEGRMIWPQFRYHRSGTLPAYSTALIYGGGTDMELNGMRFCDSPWMLGDASLDAVRNDATTLASAKSQPRLFALGYDAYTLAALIQKGDLQSGAGYASNSGELRLAPSGAISRRLDCAVIENGKPRLLNAAKK